MTSARKSLRARLGWRAVGSAVLVGAVLVAAAGCSGSSSDTQKASAGASAAHPSVTSTAMDARLKAMLDKSKLAVEVAGSAHIEGQLVAGAVHLGVKLDADRVQAAGSLTAGSGTAQMRYVQGRLYVLGTAAFWDGLEPKAGGTFADRWTEVSAATAPEFAAVIGLVPVEAAIKRLTPDSVARTEVVGMKVAGAETVGLRDQGTAQPQTIYLSQAAPGYPVLLALADRGKLSFTRWGLKLTTVKAPAAPVVDARRFPLHG